MGNVGSDAPDAGIESGQASTGVRDGVRLAACLMYLAGAVAWVCAWGAIQGSAAWRRTHFRAGILFTVMLLLLNAGMAWRETIGSVAAERVAAQTLGRDAFYLVAAVMSLGGIILHLSRDTVYAALPFIMLAILFGMILPLSPVWVSTVDGVETIMLKHARTVSLSCGIGLLITAITLIINQRGGMMAGWKPGTAPAVAVAAPGASSGGRAGV